MFAALSKSFSVSLHSSVFCTTLQLIFHSFQIFFQFQKILTSNISFALVLPFLQFSFYFLCVLFLYSIYYQRKMLFTIEFACFNCFGFSNHMQHTDFMACIYLQLFPFAQRSLRFYILNGRVVKIAYGFTLVDIAV